MRCVSCSMVMFSIFDIVVSVDTHISYTKRTFAGPKLTDLQTHALAHMHSFTHAFQQNCARHESVETVGANSSTVCYICVLHALCIKIILT